MSKNSCIDVFIGPNKDARYAYVIHQNKAPDFKEYDEDKVMLGFDSDNDVNYIYLLNFVHTKPPVINTVPLNKILVSKRMKCCKLSKNRIFLLFLVLQK